MLYWLSQLQENVVKSKFQHKFEQKHFQQWFHFLLSFSNKFGRWRKKILFFRYFVFMFSSWKSSVFFGFSMNSRRRVQQIHITFYFIGKKGKNIDTSIFNHIETLIIIQLTCYFSFALASKRESDFFLFLIRFCSLLLLFVAHSAWACLPISSWYYFLFDSSFFLIVFLLVFCFSFTILIHI